MIKIYLKTALRNIFKNKIVSGINILGLTIGLTTALLAIIFAHHELTYENCHNKAERICCVYTLGKFGSFDKIHKTFGAAKQDLEKACPEIENIARTQTVRGTAFMNDKPILESDIMVAEENIFDILSFNFLSGHKVIAPNQAVITASTARKYFGSENALGKTIKIGIWWKTDVYTITGIIEDFPSNTHTSKVSFILPFSLAKDLNWHADEHWSSDYTIYTLLNSGVDVKKINTKIASTINIPVDIENVNYMLVPIKRMHLHENIVQNTKGNFMALLIGGIVALIITLFNFINSQTVLFSTRFKEIGIKKTVGGNGKSIIYQFIVESSLSIFFSFSTAVLLLLSLLPHFNNLMDTHIQLVINGPILLSVFSILFVSVLLSSLYPAIKSIKIKSISLIRENSNHMLNKGRLSNVLVTMQFVIALLLIQFIVVSQKQVNHMFSIDTLKFDANNVVCIDGNGWGDLRVLKEKLLKDPSIEIVSWGQGIPGSNFSMTSEWKSEDNKEMANVFKSDKDYFNVFKIKMKQGRFFSDEFESDKKNSVVINPLAVSSLGLENPVGKKIMVRDKQYTIIGVCDDYISVPPIMQRLPLLITQVVKKSNFLLIRVNPNHKTKAHEHISALLSKANPDQPFTIKYYEDMVKERAKTYVATDVFIKVFTIIIILNAMLGLFALSFFISERKNKEIGIRKVCGAKVKSLVWKLSKGFVTKLAIAFVISFPLGYIIGTGYVSMFTSKISLGFDVFILSGALAFGIVLLSAGWKIWYSAIRNPVDALRYE